jgi:hypothetical protein
VRRLADYERYSGIAWIVLGALQVITVVAIIAGAWNIYAGVTRLRCAKAIEARSPAVPAAFRGVTGLVVIGLINLVLGGVIGVLLVVVDFVVRDRVLKNAHLFRAALPPAAPGTSGQSDHGTPPAGGPQSGWPSPAQHAG